VLDNFIQILLIVNLCQGSFPASLVYGHDCELFSLIGNFYYAKAAAGKREQRDDITVLPYGINTVSLLLIFSGEIGGNF